MPEEVKKDKKIEKADYRNYSEWLNSKRCREIQYTRDLNIIWSVKK